MLTEFYAVTAGNAGGSLYHVSRAFGTGADSVSAKKIAIRGESSIPVNEKFTGGMVAVCKQLVAYMPNGSKQIDGVDKKHWGSYTAPIVGLFLREEKARECFNDEQNSIHCDPRWLAETEAVIKAIGYNNLYFSVGRKSSLKLLP
ncbi:MAG: hypothetical protein WCJ74_02030 [bacterium]